MIKFTHNPGGQGFLSPALYLRQEHSFLIVQDIWHHSSPNLISPALKDVPDQKCGHGWSQHQFNWEPCFLSDVYPMHFWGLAVSDDRKSPQEQGREPAMMRQLRSM
jgi:hypothetical protein